MKLRTRLIWFFVLLLLSNAHSLRSQQLNFRLFSPSVELPWALVTGITQDKSGLMWFTTANGVHRYDGYKVITYLNEPQNPGSLANNSTECIYTDSAGIIWIGTRSAGLDRLDPVTGKFTHYQHNPNDPSSIISDNIRVIFEDHEGIFWIGTLQGLDRFDRKTGKFKHYSYEKNDITTLSSDLVKVIYEDREGTLWMGTGDAWGDPSGTGGLNRFDRKTGKFTRYVHDPKDPHSLIDNRVRAICEDSRGNFWVGTAGDGLHRMDRTRGTFERLLYDPMHPEKLSRPALNPLPARVGVADDHITFIREDGTGCIWIGTMGAGINRYDPNTQKIIHYGGTDSSGLKDYHAWWSYMSRDGVIWISTIENNLYHVDPSQTVIPQVKTVVPIRFFYQDDPHLLWMGTSSGLIQNDLVTGAKKLFKHDPLIASSIGSNTISRIISDHHGGLWIATIGGGLNRYDPGSQTFLHYRHIVNDNRSLDNNNVYAILEDHSSNLWAGTDSGLNMLDTRNRYFTRYHNNPSDSNSLSSSEAVFALLEDDDQNHLWVGTRGGGINRLNRRSGKFEHFIPGSYINCMIKDHEGTIWVAALEGLFSYNRKNKSFEKYTDPPGSVKIIDVYGVAEDRQNNLWLATSKGILRINKTRDQILVFNKNNGIKNTDFRISQSVFEDLNGKLYFPFYPDGYYSFLPDSVSQKISVPFILFEDFRIGYESVQPGKESPLNLPVNEAKEINLNYDQNAFSFDFVPINYSSPDDNRIVFKLENYDKDWRKTGTEKTVQYFNVPPGRYIFRVKAATNMGVFTEREIIVNITPPWWRTWWAYCVYGLTFIALAFYVHRFQKAIVIKAERERSRLKELAQAKEIEKAYHQLEETHETLKATQKQLIHQEKMASLGELTAGIAHEIQNPLNFVNNFSEVNDELITELVDEVDKGNYNEVRVIAVNLKDNEQKIIQHGKRADAIVKGMLQHSKSRTGIKEPTDINKLADEYLRLTYHGMRAKDKSFEVKIITDFDESIGKVNIVSQDIGRVLLNLFNNAFYAVNEKKKISDELYQPTVFVVTEKLDDQIKIKVEDNGNGIPQNIVDKIFQPFFTTKPTGQGTGLGLSLAYDIIKAHAGEIKVESQEGEGSDFIIQLHLNKLLK